MNEPGKKQSHKILATVDALVGLACGGLSAFLIYLTRHPKAVGSDEVKDAVGGLMTAAFVFAVPAVLYLICSFGLFKRWRLAWWLSLLLNLTFAFVICEDVVTDWRHSDSEDVWLAAIVGVAAVLHFARPAWQWVRRRRAPAPAASVESGDVLSEKESV